MSQPPTPVESLLRDTLHGLAAEVEPDPQAYRRAQAAWRRRERRRRLVMVVLAGTLLAGADVVGLWALNGTPPHHPIVFDAPGPAGP